MRLQLCWPWILETGVLVQAHHLLWASRLSLSTRSLTSAMDSRVPASRAVVRMEAAPSGAELMKDPL